MKKKKVETMYTIILLVVLTSILGLMIFNLNVPQKFICLDDGRIIEKADKYILKEVFNKCVNECGSGDNYCLKICADLLSDMVGIIEYEMEYTFYNMTEANK